MMECIGPTLLGLGAFTVGVGAFVGMARGAAGLSKMVTPPPVNCSDCEHLTENKYRDEWQWGQYGIEVYKHCCECPELAKNKPYESGEPAPVNCSTYNLQGQCRQFSPVGVAV